MGSSPPSIYHWSQICKQRASTDDADGDGENSGDVETRARAHDPRSFNTVYTRSYSYGHLLVITGYFYGIIHSINGVSSVLITGKGP